MKDAMVTPASASPPPFSAQQADPSHAEKDGVLDQEMPVPAPPSPHVEEAEPRIGKVKGICLTAVCATAMLMNVRCWKTYR